VSYKDDSELLLAKLMSRLEDNGVRQLDYSVYDFFDEPVSSDNEALFVELVKWLENEGVVRCGYYCSGSRTSETVCNLVLTSWGFRLLSTEFKANLTLSQAVHNVSSGASGHGKVGELVGGLLGAFTNAIANG
jgi:hypothetical protein